MVIDIRYYVVLNVVFVGIILRVKKLKDIVKGVGKIINIKFKKG